MSRFEGRAHSETGAIMLLAVMLALPILALMALAFDGFVVRAARNQLQSSSEFAAMAALRMISSPGGTVESARLEAERVAKFNVTITRHGQGLADGELDMTRSAGNRSGSIHFGNYSTLDGSFTISPDCSSGCNAVQVSLRTKEGRYIRTFFAKAIGVPEVSTSAHATAFFDPARAGPATAPYYLIHHPLIAS